MEGKKPRAALVRTVVFLSRTALVVALLAGGSVVVSDPSRGDDPSTMTRALFEAVENNDLGAVRAAVADGARIEARSPFGMRPVDLAIDKGYYEIAHYLLSLHNVREAANAAATEGGTPDPNTAAGLAQQPLPPSPPAIQPPSPPVAPASRAREDEPATTALPSETASPSLAPEPDLAQSAPPDAEPAQAPRANGGGIFSRTSSRIKQAAQSFDETFDTFLGGWFFRWVGRKLARSDRQDASDGTVAVAELAIPDRSALSSGQTPEIAPPPIPERLTAVTAEIPLAATPPAAAASPQTVEPALTESTAGKGAPAAEPVAAPAPITPPIAATSEPTLNESSTPPLPTVAVEPRKVLVHQQKAATTTREPPPVAPPAAPLPPSPSRQSIDPQPTVAAVADPFAPDAVAPGTRHPVIGEKPPTPPPAPPPEHPEATKPGAAPLPASNSAKASDKTAPPPAKPASSAGTSSAQKKADPAIPTKEGDMPGRTRRLAANANPTGLLDQLAETPRTEKADSTAAKEDWPRGLEGPADTVAVAPVRTAMVSTPAPARRAPDSVLTLGSSIHIAAAMPPESDDPSERNFCVKKSRGAVVFCVEPVDWPARLSRQLRVNSIMYQGAQAIVRYDNGAATRIYAIFPTESHAALISHYTQRFGKPTATSEHAITPFAQPRQSNQVVSWQRIDPLTHEKTTLEIRRYDDTRGGFPDMRYGAILLFNAASPPIFPILSTLDLMPTSTQ